MYAQQKLTCQLIFFPSKAIPKKSFLLCSWINGQSKKLYWTLFDPENLGYPIP